MPSITIEDDVDGGIIEDTFLDENIGKRDDNYGIYVYVAVEQTQIFHPLMQVDLTGYSGVTVINSRFGIDIYSEFGPVTFWYEVLKEWIQGTKNGAAAANGEPTWNSVRHGEESWNTAGCNGADSDYNSTYDGTANPLVNANFHIDITNALAQKWVDNAADNNGITFKSGKFFWRSTEAVTGNKPYFYMEYTAGSYPSKPIPEKLSGPVPTPLTRPNYS